MADSSIEDHSYFWWLLGWRALLALVAIYTVLAKPFPAILITFAVLTVLFLTGEGIYKSVVFYEQERLRAEKDRELRERRAEDARLRFAALKQAQEESAREFMVFENEGHPAAEGSPAPPANPGQ